MASGKSSPRQKMINMMYLVLTALLALNVSKDILDAFVIVNDSLETTNEGQKATISSLYFDFETALSSDENKTKVPPFYNAAMNAKKYTNDIYDSIQELKKYLISKVEGYDYPPVDADKGKLIDSIVENLGAVNNKDNYDIPTHILIPEPSNPEVGKAHELKLKLSEFREGMLDLIKDEKLEIENKKGLLDKLGNLGINTNNPTSTSDSDPADMNWEGHNFYHSVIVATVCLLTKMQNDLRNAEYQVVNALLGQVFKDDYKVDKINGRIIPNSNYILQGDDYEAQLFVAAYSTTNNPIILIGDGYDEENARLTGRIDTIPVENGVGILKRKESSTGLKKFAAMIRLKKPNTDGSKEDDWNQYPIKDIEYRVAPPNVVVSPTAMNVLYRGIANPVSVSAAGMSIEDLVISPSNGTIVSQSGGNIEIIPGTGETTVVNVSANVNGGMKKLGEMSFRVKSLPKPTATVAKRDGGNIRQRQLKEAGKVEASAEDFLFAVNYVVTSFRMSVQLPSGLWIYEDCNGANYDEKVKSLIDQVRVNQSVVFERITAVGPDRKAHNLSQISFRIIP